MEPVAPIYFRPRERPKASSPADVFFGRPLSAEEKTVLEQIHPSSTTFDATGSRSLRKRCDFNVIHSVDPNAHLVLNGCLKVPIGVGLFSFPCGSLTFAMEIVLFHQGDVKIEHLALTRELEYAFERVTVNIVVNPDQFLVLSNGLFTNYKEHPTCREQGGS